MNKKTNKKTVNNMLEEEPLEDWDKVICKNCGKKISMLEAKLISTGYGYEYFICEKGCR